jgi:hypothetical protein
MHSELVALFALMQFIIKKNTSTTHTNKNTFLVTLIIASEMKYLK